MTLDSNKTKVKLLNFIQSKLGYQVSDLKGSFDMAGIDGLDADIFFKSFQEEFNIDMKEFDFSRYFQNENPYPDLIKNIIKYWGKKRYFNFQHLIDVIEKGEWFDPS